LCSRSSAADSSPVDQKSRRNVSAFKIMTVSRGFTEEGDKLLDYLVMHYRLLACSDKSRYELTSSSGTWYIRCLETSILTLFHICYLSRMTVSYRTIARC
jgi:hypothetical protein